MDVWAIAEQRVRDTLQQPAPPRAHAAALAPATEGTRHVRGDDLWRRVRARSILESLHDLSLPPRSATTHDRRLQELAWVLGRSARSLDRFLTRFRKPKRQRGGPAILRLADFQQGGGRERYHEVLAAFVRLGLIADTSSVRDALHGGAEAAVVQPGEREPVRFAHGDWLSVYCAQVFDAVAAHVGTPMDTLTNVVIERPPAKSRPGPLMEIDLFARITTPTGERLICVEAKSGRRYFTHKRQIARTFNHLRHMNATQAIAHDPVLWVVGIPYDTGDRDSWAHFRGFMRKLSKRSGPRGIAIASLAPTLIQHLKTWEVRP